MATSNVKEEVPSPSLMNGGGSEDQIKDGQVPSSTTRKRRRILIVGLAILLLLAIGMGVGLGVGLTQGKDDSLDGNGSDSSDLPTLQPPNGTKFENIWQPTVGSSWNYILLSPLQTNATNGTQILDIDLFDNSAEIIQGLQANGSKVICYFSAGSYESWRPDASQFQPDDLGKPLQGWPGERWLNVSSPNVHSIMEQRMDMAVEKHCDALDPDNVDGYNNNNGLGLTEFDAIRYLSFLSEAAHSRNLSIGLKNAGAIVENVIQVFQFSVQEQCEEYKECEQFQPFIEQDKPVFHVEYPKGENTNNLLDISQTQQQQICSDQNSKNFSTIIKNIDLDWWIETC